MGRPIVLTVIFKKALLLDEAKSSLIQKANWIVFIKEKLRFFSGARTLIYRFTVEGKNYENLWDTRN